MTDDASATLARALLGFELAGSRLAVEGVSLRPAPDGSHELAASRIEAGALRFALGEHVLEVGRLALHEVTGQLQWDAGKPRLSALRAARAETSSVRLAGPVNFPVPTAPPAAGTWSLEPLAAAEGRIGAQIKDASLIFDANVTVPIRQGQIDFNAATVEHVGPDSRMGVSKLGIYVDAPNGRSYLYQFSPAPVAGVSYERRGAFLGQRVSDRGSLQLQAFAEALLLQARGGAGAGFTDQARLLLERTAVTGFVQLGDGRLAAPGVQAQLSGRAAGRNVVRLHSAAVGRGVTLEIEALGVPSAALNLPTLALACDDVAGALKLQLDVDHGALRFALELPSVQVAGLRLGPFP